ncbi:mitochondrial inner membrane protease subunit [Cokeromyces recurvatus]|uniref:mitochondrial inner membrane protease subunit n=1 Tax=Cokeromyces recurvatus TaxID=90255 RepID=UPI002220C553|nr:mitochondrial inner membrane protease subunit [Cokeromyces recurvatus]KAI7906720.1 mitochondrial inner membrane protease subunit [Cokeromyces recurvatus]
MIFARLRAKSYTSSVLTALTWMPVAIFFVDHGYSYGVISGRSMQPTFNPDSSMLKKDIVLLDKWSTTDHQFERGQVVTLISPINPKCIITKRILALPGDRVQSLRNKNEWVSIPEGHVWVEGDEAFHSRDSNSFGPVPIALINAKVTHILWPFSRFGPVEKKSVNKDRVQMNVFRPGVDIEPSRQI